MRTEIKKIAIGWIMIMVIVSNSFAMECRSAGSRCISEGERVVDGFKVNRCWRYEDAFECKYPSKDDCKSLRKQGCLHVIFDEMGSNPDKCLKVHDSKCLNYQKNYMCYREKEIEVETVKTRMKPKDNKKKARCRGDIACIDGSCFEEESEEMRILREKANMKDMQDAITQMTALESMAKDFSKDNVSVFKGDVMECKKNPIVNFRDCCGAKPSGWGTSIGFTRCSAKAKAMLARRQAGHCVDLGTYCAKKAPIIGTCLTKKHRYCCFSGKLQRIIHEQGRRQLGISFGSAKEPNCRGLKVEELSRMKFDQMEFKEFYEDVAKNYKTPNIDAINKRIGNTFANIAKDFKNKESVQKDQIPFRNKKLKGKVRDESGIIVDRPHM